MRIKTFYILFKLFKILNSNHRSIRADMFFFFLFSKRLLRPFKLDAIREYLYVVEFSEKFTYIRYLKRI